MAEFGYVVCSNKITEVDQIKPRLFFTKIDSGKPVAVVNSGVNLSLYCNGEKGLFNQFWKNWADWIIDDRTSVEFKKDCSLLEIRNLDFSSKYEINGNNYLLSELQVTLTKTFIKQATVKAFSCF